MPARVEQDRRRPTEIQQIFSLRSILFPVLAASFAGAIFAGCGRSKGADAQQQSSQMTSEQYEAAAQARIRQSLQEKRDRPTPTRAPQPRDNLKTISESNSTRTDSPYKPCFPTRAELENWLTFSVDADYDDKYDYISKNDPYTLSPYDKVRVIAKDADSFQDGQTIVTLYISPNKSMPYPGDGQKCFASDDGVLFSNE